MGTKNFFVIAFTGLLVSSTVFCSENPLQQKVIDHVKAELDNLAQKLAKKKVKGQKLIKKAARACATITKPENRKIDDYLKEIGKKLLPSEENFYKNLCRNMGEFPGQAETLHPIKKWLALGPVRKENTITEKIMELASNPEDITVDKLREIQNFMTSDVQENQEDFGEGVISLALLKIDILDLSKKEET